MVRPSLRRRAPRWAALAALAAAAVLVIPPVSPADPVGPTLEGPIPGSAPGDPASPVLGETYPFFSTWHDLAGAGYVEQEYYLSGVADAYATSGAKLVTDVAYRTRLIVRRPVSDADFNGTVLVEWQNVTAGYDLDALWNVRHLREGYVWVGVSAQRVGVDQLRGWSPTRANDPAQSADQSKRGSVRLPCSPTGPGRPAWRGAVYREQSRYFSGRPFQARG